MIFDYCDVTTKRASELSKSIYGENPKEDIKLPKYQRSLVWGKQKKEKFIESLKHGFPVGAILLHKKGETNGKTEYLIIDGLQRTTTIYDYIKNPTSYNIDSDLAEVKIDAMIKEVLAKIKSKCGKSINPDKFKNYLLEYIGSNNVEGFSEAQGYSAFKCIGYLNKQLNNILKQDDFHDDFSKILNQIKENAQIDNVKIPVIEYSGPSENLPEIFTRLNTQGTQLNKYQIFAAMWDDTKIKILNEDIISKIQGKYLKIKEAGLAIGTDEEEETIITKFNVFEYLFGLGKYLTSDKYEKYKILFKTESDTNQIEEPETFIFVLSSAILFSEDVDYSKKMENLDKEIKKVNQADFEKAILDSIDETYKILEPILNFPFNINKNKSSNNISTPFSEIQIITIVAYLIKEKYDKKFKPRNDFDKKKYKEVKDNILLYYLYDVLNGYWESSTDTQMTNTITEKRFHTKIEKELWERTYEIFFEEQLNKRHKDRTQFNKKDLLFLRYIYSKSTSAFTSNSSVSYQVDHIIPVEVLKERAQQIGGLPISAVGNLCLLSDSLNQDKNDDLIPEYLSKLSSPKEKKAKKDIENSLFMKIDNIPSIRKNISEETYKNFLKDRHSILEEKFYEMYVI